MLSKEKYFTSYVFSFWHTTFQPSQSLPLPPSLPPLSLPFLFSNLSANSQYLPNIDLHKMKFMKSFSSLRFQAVLMELARYISEHYLQTLLECIFFFHGSTGLKNINITRSITQAKNTVISPMEKKRSSSGGQELR